MVDIRASPPYFRPRGQTRLNSELKRRYLAILGAEEAEPTFELLRRIVGEQLIRAPFENISKLDRYRSRGITTIPSLTEYLEGIERCSFGGTCYSNNFHLYTLLRSLGFDIVLCGADMRAPDVHLVSMVRLRGRQFLVDVGYGGPFFEPLPRDLDCEHRIDFGRCRYVLHPQDALGRSRLDMLRDGRHIHGYLAKPEPRTIDDFAEDIRNSYRPEASFMNAVVIERFAPGRSVRIHNLTLTETEAGAGSTSAELCNVEELVDAVEHHCGIPGEVTLRAIEGLNLDADIYS